MSLMLVLLIQAQEPTLEDRIAAFIKGDAAARESLLKHGAPAIRPLLKERDKAPEKIEELLFEIRARVAHPKDTPLVEKLRKPASVKLHKSKFEDALGFVREFCGVPVVVDRWEAKDLLAEEVTVEVGREPVRRALDLICRQTGLDYGIFHNAVVVGKPERLWPAEKARAAFGPPAAERQHKTPDDEQLLKRLRELKVDMDFQNQPLSGVAGYLKEFTGIGVETGEETGAAKLTFKLRGCTLYDSLCLLTQTRDLDFMIRDGKIAIDKREALEKPAGKTK
ncbi:MAG TPA: hypothetical protein VFS19_01280 [Planctomycetota bacterium]|nr:hypothetical protein [Planctomycetota bacterium]